MANRKQIWTDKDVTSGKEVCDDGRAAHDMSKVDPKHLEATIDQIAQFWQTYGERVKEAWKELPLDQREKMILACCPYLPAYRGTMFARDGTDLNGIATLAPEINLRDLSGDGLIQLFEQYGGKEYDCVADYLAHADYIETVRHRFAPLPNMKNQFFLPLKDRLCWLVLNKPEHKPQIDKWGVALWGEIGYYAIQRKMNIVSLLAGYADELRTTFFDAQGMKVTREFIAGGCGYCHRPSPPQRCGGCKHVPYCSQECQKADWPKHKLVCTGRKGNK